MVRKQRDVNFLISIHPTKKVDGGHNISGIYLRGGHFWLVIPNEVVCSFPQPLLTNARIVLKTGMEQFSSTSFPMIIHSSSYH
jgi:hypothetical protein